MFKLLNFNKNWNLYQSNTFRKLDIFLIYNFNYKTWFKINKLRNIFKFGIFNKKTHAYYFNTPLNNQRTRSKSPISWKLNKHILFFKFISQIVQLKKIKLSKNFLIFDYINRLWFKQWNKEWLKINQHWLKVKKFAKKNKAKVNIPILKYKYIIRNFKVVNKKKQKFLKQFNLGIISFEYVNESLNSKRYVKKTLKKKYGKYFILKQRVRKR